VSADLELEVSGANESSARVVAMVGVADPEQYEDVDEDIEITLDGRPLSWQEVIAPFGGRLWVIDSEPGRLEIHYGATVTGLGAVRKVALADELLYARASRYCESDRLTGFAAKIFAGVDDPHDLLAAVSSWVGTHLDYVSGSSDPTDGAVQTLLAAQGVCRDYAHLVVTLLRAMGIPARLAAVYAPGLDPMDFHAVAEAAIDGQWYVVDGTLLAPRETLLRIATGRDAADTAFLSNSGGSIEMGSMTVGAIVQDGDLPVEDVTELVRLR
jgi:transglutaminase-like putative cysteine protease